jgi:hypothetical protein
VQELLHLANSQPHLPRLSLCNLRLQGRLVLRVALLALRCCEALAQLELLQLGLQWLP